MNRTRSAFGRRNEEIMKKALFIGALSIATLATAAAFACGGKGGPGAHADANGDGKITLAESQAAAKARFDKLDANKNGSVERSEAGGRGRLFERVDANNDGKVTLAEMQNKAKQHFAARDANKDNVLTQDEIGHRGRGHGKKDHPRS
jgi:hypothetical protein